MVWRQMCEGYYFDRRQRDAAVPHDPGGVQAAIAHLRQAANLLSPVHPDAVQLREVLIISTLEDTPLYESLLGRGMAWLDTGTPSNMLKAAEFVEAAQDRQGFYVSCIEEIAWRRGFITTEQLAALGEELKVTDYGQYLLTIVGEGK